MKRRFLLLILLLSLLAGCSQAEQTLSPEPTVVTATNTPDATSSSTPEPTYTAVPTQTPQPTATEIPSPTATLTPPVISVETGRQLSFSGRLGDGAMAAVALSADAAHVAVLTTVMLKVFAAESGDLVWEVECERVFEDIAYSDDGSQLIARSRGGAVQRWNAATGETLGEPLPVVPDTRAVSMAANGSSLITLDNFDQSFIWDTSTGEQLQTNNGLAFPFGAMDVAVSADGLTFLNSGIDSKLNFQVRLWDMRQGRFLTGLRGLPGAVHDLRFSMDGKFVTAMGTRVSGGLRGTQILYLWRVSDGALLDVVDLSLDVSTHTFLADGSTVLAGTADGKVFFASFRFGERYTYGYIKDQFFAHEAPVIDLSTSGDGLKFASAAADGSVKIWDVQSGEAVFSTVVEGLSLQTLKQEWTYEQLEVLARPHLPGMAVSPVSNLIARTAADLHSIDLIDPISGEVFKKLQLEASGYYAAPVFSSDGKTVAAAFNNKQIILWDVESGLDVLRITTQHTRPITRLQFSPDGIQIASLGEGELLVWNLETITMAQNLTAFRTFAYSGDGVYLLADAQEGGVYLIDAKTGKKSGFIASDIVNDLAFSPDNSRIAVAGYRSPMRYEQENLVYFLDIAEGKQVKTIQLSGYPAEVMHVAYTPDGSGIISVDGYGDIYVWNAAAGTLLQRFEERVSLPASIHFSPDGRTMMVAGGDNSIQFFQVNTGE